MDRTARLRIRRQTTPRDLAEEGGEINVVPFLDIVVNVIMFLLATTSVAMAVSRIDVASGGGEVPRAGFEVTVAIGDEGFHVTSTDGVRTLPDLAALTGYAEELKRTHPDDSAVIVTAEADVPYETVVRTLDAIRSRDDVPLFPDVLLSAGIQ